MPSKKKLERAPKVAVKKTVAKKVAAKAAPKRRVVAKPVAQHVHGKTVTHHRVVLYETCTNCAHFPDRISSIIGTLSVLVAILSGMVISLAPSVTNWQNLVAHADSSTLSLDQSVARSEL